MTCFGGMSPGPPGAASAPGPLASRSPWSAPDTLATPLRRLQRAGRGLGMAGFEGLEAGNGFLSPADLPHTHRPQAPLSVQAPTMGPPSQIFPEIHSYVGVVRVYAWK